MRGDLVGLRFGRLVVLGQAPSKKGQYLMRVECDCGVKRVVWRENLLTGNTRSCGCLRRETVRRMRTTHGTSHERERRIWYNMIRRCHDCKDRGYPDYGGRGIKVCAKWRRSYRAFLRDVGRKPRGLSLDRIDNNRGYAPGNCRWASPKVQSRNSRHNVVLSFGGVTLCISGWAERLGIGKVTLTTRLRRGWSVERALTCAVQCKRRVRVCGKESPCQDRRVS